MRNQNVIRAATLAGPTTIALAPFTARAQQAASGASADEIAALREQIRLLDHNTTAEDRRRPGFVLGKRDLAVACGDERLPLHAGDHSGEDAVFARVQLKV